MSVNIEQEEQKQPTLRLLLGEIGEDLQAHIEDSIRSKEFEYASCYGCGLRVKHDGYCHRCA